MSRVHRRWRVGPAGAALVLALSASLVIATRVLWPAPAERAAHLLRPARAAAPRAAGSRDAVDGVAGGWRTGPAIPTERSEVAAAVVDGTIYVLGGLAADGRTLQTVEALPPGTDAWETRAPLPQPRDHLAAASLEGRLYAVAGSPGWFGQDTSATLWVYDPASDSWDARAPLPLGRAAHAAAVLDGKLYVAGGIGPDAQRLQVYDPATDDWQLKAPLPFPREHLAAAALGGTLYVVGGRWGDVGNLDTVQAYDPTADRWRTLPPLPTRRGGLAATTLDGRIFVTGGEALDDSRATFPQLEVYDPTGGGGAWLSGPPLPTARHGLAAVSRGGEVYVLAGGRRAGLEVSGVVEIFTPAS